MSMHRTFDGFRPAGVPELRGPRTRDSLGSGQIGGAATAGAARQWATCDECGLRVSVFDPGPTRIPWLYKHHDGDVLCPGSGRGVRREAISR